MNKGFAIATVLLVLMAAIAGISMYGSSSGSSDVADQMKAGMKMVFSVDGSASSIFYAKLVGDEIKVQSQSAGAHDSGFDVTEVHGGKQYSYSIPNIATLQGEVQDEMKTDVSEFAGIKAGCAVADADIFSSDLTQSVDANGNSVLGSSLTFKKGADGSYDSVSFTNGEGETQVFTIISLGPIPEGEAAGLFGGCVVGRDLEQLDQVGRSLAGRETSELFVQFQQLASQTLWCGAGTDVAGTPCPGSSGLPGYIVAYDLTADRACMRHDSGKKSAPVGPAVKLGCDVDHGLVARTNNFAAQAIFGKWGLAGVWGCFDEGPVSKWHNSLSCGWRGCRGWMGWYTVTEERTLYGPWRYCTNAWPSSAHDCGKRYRKSYGWDKAKAANRCGEQGLRWGAGQI